jgi:hypothetical protein
MKLIELKKDKGQAAMTDSLFFLTIIVALCVLLFKFSSTYGDRIDLAVNNLYFKEYTNSTLKTIFYTDIPLDFDKNAETSPETDYLITAIKSDFLYNQKIGFSDVNSLTTTEDVRDLAKFNLFHTIKSLMHPLPNYDYLYYIQKADGLLDTYYFMLKINYVDSGELKNKYYLCDPTGPIVIRSLVQRSNKIYSSSTPLIFKIADLSISEVRAVSNLTIWASTESISPYIIESDFANDLRCQEYIEP